MSSLSIFGRKHLPADESSVTLTAKCPRASWIQRRARGPLFAIVAALLLAATPAFAGDATETVRGKQNQLVDLIKQPTSKQRQEKIAATFDEILDYEHIAAASLGAEWDGRSEAEKAEFRDVLKKLVRRTYERNLRKTLGYDVTYVREEGAGEGVFAVTTKAQSKSSKHEDPIEIVFKMHNKNGAWKIRDIVTEGSSLVGNYRSQFTRIIKKNGFATLMSKLKDKLAKGEA